jgi:hypothetical protein
MRERRELDRGVGERSSVVSGVARLGLRVGQVAGHQCGQAEREPQAHAVR